MGNDRYRSARRTAATSRPTPSRSRPAGRWSSARMSRSDACPGTGAAGRGLLGSEPDPGRETPMQARRMCTITAPMTVMLAMAPFTGVQAQSLPADDSAYFASAAAEQAARGELGKRVEALQQASALAPAQRFHQAEALQAQCLRHHSYLHLQAARNARDHRPTQALDQVMGLCSRIAHTGRAALREAPADAAWAAPYAFLRARALKDAAAPASTALDEAVEALADPALDSFARLRGQILRSAEYPQIERDGRHWDTGHDKQALAQQRDRALPDAGWKGDWRGLHPRREPMASV